ncbi:MAG: PAS domain S-box protein, partial [Polyangiaceae bacterium]
TAATRLRTDLEHANQELETAYEELQSTNEELETTNEELQSTVEELETTNEELQSTNEELETMNEELQSTNEELQTMNEELRERGTELNQLNAFFSAILSSLRSGVVVLDNELLVRAWNPRMEDLWGLRADEVQGKHFLNLDIGLPLERLGAPIRRALSSSDEALVTVDSINRRGKAIRCKMSAVRLEGDEPRGVIILFDEVDADEVVDVAKKSLNVSET